MANMSDARLLHLQVQNMRAGPLRDEQRYQEKLKVFQEQQRQQHEQQRGPER